jgi:subtilisin family serine protease
MEVGMRLLLQSALVVLAALALLTQSAVRASADYVPNHVIVRWNPGASTGCIDSSLAAVSGTVVATVTDSAYTLVELADTNVTAAVSTLKGWVCVFNALPDWLIAETLTSANDPYYSRSWHLHNTGQTGGTSGADINAEEGWSFNTDASGILVATLDTGLGYNDSDLVANVWNNPGESGLDGLGNPKKTNGIDDDSNGKIDDYYGYDFYATDPDPMDEGDPHGTYVTSVMAATGNNNVGLTGVAWGAKVAGVRCGNAGFISSAAAPLAMKYARKIGAKILNLSWGGQGAASSFSWISNEVDTALAVGQLVVCAAGNNNGDNDYIPGNPVYPASLTQPNIISVGMTDADDEPARGAHKCSNNSQTNIGATSVDIFAPGCSIWSETQFDIYQTHSGTSLAAPQVTAAAAMVWAQHPTWTYADVKNRLMVTVDTLASLSGKCVSGGRLNIGRALDNVPPDDPGLTFVSGGRHEIALGFIDQGDDGASGQARAYDFRYSTSNITNESQFNSASHVPMYLGPPDETTTPHCITVTGLAGCTTYYFALKLEDGEFNYSTFTTAHGTTACSGNQLSVCDFTGNRAPEARTPGNETDQPVAEWSLGMAAPNPSSGNVTIAYSLKHDSRVAIRVYNVAGRLIRTLVNMPLGVGPHTVVWDRRDDDGARMRSGMFYYRMVADDWQDTHRVVLVGQ